MMKRKTETASQDVDRSHSVHLCNALSVYWMWGAVDESHMASWNGNGVMTELRSVVIWTKARSKEREKRGSSKYLVEIVDASEIHCMISAPCQEILKKVILGHHKCITLFSDWTPPRECSGTLLNSNHLLYFKVECSTTLFLMQSICSGGLKDRRRWVVTCDYCWQVQRSHVIQMLSNGK